MVDGVSSLREDMPDEEHSGVRGQGGSVSVRCGPLWAGGQLKPWVRVRLTRESSRERRGCVETRGPPALSTYGEYGRPGREAERPRAEGEADEKRPLAGKWRTSFPKKRMIHRVRCEEGARCRHLLEEPDLFCSLDRNKRPSHSS